MRLLLAFCLVAASSFAAPAQADGPLLGGFGRALTLDPQLVLELSPRAALPTLPPLTLLQKGPLIVQPDYGWIAEEARTFWYAAGASAVTALGTHVLIGLPTLFIGLSVTAFIGATSPVAALALALSIGGAYAAAESLLSGLAGQLVFNNISRVYEADFIVGFLGHFAGDLLAAGVVGVTFGYGGMLIGGLGLLAGFLGSSAGFSSVVVFSVLGAMPAVVVGGIAVIAVPALVQAWAMSVAARPRAGYAIDEKAIVPPQLPPRGVPQANLFPVVVPFSLGEHM